MRLRILLAAADLLVIDPKLGTVLARQGRQVPQQRCVLLNDGVLEGKVFFGGGSEIGNRNGICGMNGLDMYPNF